MTVIESAIERYVAATTLAQALECLRDTDDTTVLAGGTDVMPQTQIGRRTIGRALLNIRRIDELRGIAEEGATVRIGALTTITELMTNEIVRRRFPVLVETGDHFASDQIRNAATVGGNLCNASPAGDTLVPLLVLDAEVELASMGDAGVVRRRIALNDFFVGPGRTKRTPAELLVAVHVPVPADGHFARFFKFGTRPALDISTISIALAAVQRNGTLSNVRVAFGAVAPTPVRSPHTEQALEGRRLDAATIAEAARAARDEVQPIDDVRASAWYRKEMIHNMTARMLSHVADA